MSGKLEVSFNSPQCGWMSIGVADGSSEFHTTTAHTPHALALPELLKILTALLDANSMENDHLLKWNRDPEEFDFRFGRDGEYVSLEIYQYPSDQRESRERELVFTHKGNIRDVCGAFAVTFEQLYADRDIDEFEFNWRQPFPFREFEEFKKRIS